MPPFFPSSHFPSSIPKKNQRAARDILSQIDGSGSFRADRFGLMVMADAAELFESMLAQAAALEPLPAEMEQHRLFLPALRQKVEARLSALADT